MPVRSVRRSGSLARAGSLIKRMGEALKAAVAGPMRAPDALPVPIRVEQRPMRRR